MNLTELTKYPEDKIRSLVGLTPEALGQLLLTVLPEIEQRRQKQQADKPKRKRKIGGGRKRLLKPYQEILLTLMYLRHNVAFSVVGLIFGVSADVAENTFHEIVAVLRDLCPANRYEAEKRWTKKEPSWKPDDLDKIIIDSFETPIPRPSEKEKQKKFYSGKKKDHTIKTQVATDGKGEIQDIDPGHRGPMADKRLYEASSVETTYPSVKKEGDLAYLGLPGVAVPHKKPRKGELTGEQKASNQAFSSGRVHVEHGIRRIKAFRILRDEYRLGTGLFSMIASATVGLVQLIRLVG
jgi:hypothetical protein